MVTDGHSCMPVRRWVSIPSSNVPTFELAMAAIRSQGKRPPRVTALETPVISTPMGTSHDHTTGECDDPMAHVVKTRLTGDITT